jgi:hypothetical protein
MVKCPGTGADTLSFSRLPQAVAFLEIQKPLGTLQPKSIIWNQPHASVDLH